jgi:catechol 2,3-dioxygenase-like lactoylglutathione lyase family enzyme
MDILNLEILTPDLAKTEAFYTSVLGLKTIHKSTNQISFQAGTSELTFIHTETINPVYHIAFNIPNNQLAEALIWTESKVPLIDVEPGNKIADFVNWNAKSIYFFDTTGNILEFIARFELDNKNDTPFTGLSITCISEVGLAVDDVATQCDELVSAHSLPVFSRQPRLQNFSALGDDNGLLIISIVNRHWYLTDIPAQKYHTKILIKNNDQLHSLSFH